MPEPRDGRLQLSEMVAALRRDLADARESIQPGDATFLVQAIELEAAVEIQTTKTGTGGVKFYVVEAGGAVGRANTSAHRVRLTLAPTRQTHISDEGEGE